MGKPSIRSKPSLTEATNPLEADASRFVARGISDAPPMSRLVATVSVLRDIIRAALAGAVVGVVVLGPGGRVVMRLAAIIDPSSVGQLTENGNRIGEITLGGTFALLIFGGLLVGLAFSVVWLAIYLWIPGHGWRRAVLCMPIAIALSSFVLVAAGNPDFLTLDPDGPIIAMLLGLAAVAGLAFAVADTWLDGRLPPAADRPRQRGIAYLVAALVGLALILPLTVGFFFVFDEPPVAIGAALVVAGFITLIAWALRIATGGMLPPPILRVIGGVTLAAAVALGGWHLIDQVARILTA